MFEMTLWLVIGGHFPTLLNGNIQNRLIIVPLLHLLDGPNDVHTLHHPTKHHVLVVQMRGLPAGNKELTPVGALPGVGHGEQSSLRVLELEILVVKLLPVYRLSAHAVPQGEIPSLNHEILNDPVEGASLVMKGLPALPRSFFPGAETPKVLCGLGGNVAVELHDDPSEGRFPMGDVKEDVGIVVVGIGGDEAEAVIVLAFE